MSTGSTPQRTQSSFRAEARHTPTGVMGDPFPSLLATVGAAPSLSWEPLPPRPLPVFFSLAYRPAGLWLMPWSWACPPPVALFPPGTSWPLRILGVECLAGPSPAALRLSACTCSPMDCPCPGKKFSRKKSEKNKSFASCWDGAANLGGQR